jgi:hypothetical protein
VSERRELCTRRALALTYDFRKCIQGDPLRQEEHYQVGKSLMFTQSWKNPNFPASEVEKPYSTWGIE